MFSEQLKQALKKDATNFNCTGQNGATRYAVVGVYESDRFIVRWQIALYEGERRPSHYEALNLAKDYTERVRSMLQEGNFELQVFGSRAYLVFGDFFKTLHPVEIKIKKMLLDGTVRIPSRKFISLRNAAFGEKSMQ